MNNDELRLFRGRTEPPLSFVMFDSAGSQLRAASSPAQQGLIVAKREIRMRKSLFVAAAATVFAAPAWAAPSGPYVGIEGGITLPQTNKYDVTVTNGTASTTYADGYRVRDRTGYDVDLIAGYQLGLLRLEA